MTAFAGANPQEFYEMATKNGEAEARQFYATSEKEKQRVESRVKEFDNIIRCLYDDRVCVRISVERYDAMAVGYETEQAELKQELASITRGVLCRLSFGIQVRHFPLIGLSKNFQVGSLGSVLSHIR